MVGVGWGLVVGVGVGFWEGLGDAVGENNVGCGVRDGSVVGVGVGEASCDLDSLGWKAAK